MGAIHDAGVPVAHLGVVPAPQLARTLVERAGEADVVWVSSADGDPGLTDAVASEVTRLPDPPEVEVLVGSWDVPGSRLLDLVAVMDRLRSPGGCPWDAAQTHESLVEYLLEEAHEAVEAIESGDRAHIREELGDVLLQVAFQSRVGEEHPVDPFDIDDVAAGIVEKLVRRHPHVFADADATTAEEVERNWEVIKAEERQERQERQERAAKAATAGEATHPGGEAGTRACCTAYRRRCPPCWSPRRCWPGWNAPVATSPGRRAVTTWAPSCWPWSHGHEARASLRTPCCVMRCASWADHTRCGSAHRWPVELSTRAAEATVASRGRMSNAAVDITGMSRRRTPVDRLQCGTHSPGR